MPARLCYMINETLRNPDGSWNPAIVLEHESGYRPTNYNWTGSYEVAKQCVDRLNTRLGLSEKDVDDIIASSIGAQHQLSRAKHTRLEKLPLLINSKCEEVQTVVKKRLSTAK